MSEMENQTKSRVLDRFQGHFGDISSGRDTTVARHFNGCTSDNPNKFSSIQISVLAFIKANPHSITAGKQEKHWIHQLHTAVPRGLNLMDSFQGNLWWAHLVSKTGHEIYRTPSCQDTGPKYFISQCFSLCYITLNINVYYSLNSQFTYMETLHDTHLHDTHLFYILYCLYCFLWASSDSSPVSPLPVGLSCRLCVCLEFRTHSLSLYIRSLDSKWSLLNLLLKLSHLETISHWTWELGREILTCTRPRLYIPQRMNWESEDHWKPNQ